MISRLLSKLLLTDLLLGLWTTFKHLCKKPVTVQYPKERLQLAPRFRGLFQLLQDEVGEEICNGCGVCALQCPVDVIRIVREGKGKDSIAAEFDIDLIHCLYCGICVEVCPRECLVMTDYFELANFERSAIMHKDDLYKEHVPLTFAK